MPRTPRRPLAPTSVEVLDSAAADAQTVLQRTDATNSALATLSGVLLTLLAAAGGLTSTTSSAPGPAQAATAAAATVLAGVLGVLATAMWPRRGGAGGVPRYAQMTTAQVQQELLAADAARHQAERVAVLSRIAVRKHAAQRRAVAGLAAAGLMLAAAVVLTALA